MTINAKGLHFSELNSKIKNSVKKNIKLENVCGHRYIGSGTNDKVIEIEGVPGNALGAYLNGSKILCQKNVQDATGDTMNAGEIIIYGSTGDACGYAMRGGKIFVRDNAGYRAGIHMKAYKEQNPLIIIGEKAADFLGEYQAGGTIVVLGLHCDDIPIGNFCGTGMHGGKIYIRSNKAPRGLPNQVTLTHADENDLSEIMSELKIFSQYFNVSISDILSKKFFILTPNTKNPYKQLYTYN